MELSRKGKAKAGPPRAKKSSNFRQRPNVEYRGRKFNPGKNPPDVTLSPFNHLVVVHLATDSKNASFTTSDILKQVIAQIDPDTKQGLRFDCMELRLYAVRVWNISGKMISLRANDYANSTSTTTVTMCTTMDVCGGNDWACAAFEWPTSHKQMTLSPAYKNSLFDIMTGENDKAVVYITVLWRFVGQPVIKYSGDLLFNISQDVKNISTQSLSLVEQQKESNAHLKEIVKNQPGLVSKIVDGITHVGAYVAPLAADAELVNMLEELKKSIDDLALVSQYETSLT